VIFRLASGRRAAPAAPQSGSARPARPGRHVQMPAIDRQFLRSGSNNLVTCDNTSDYLAYLTIFEE